MLASSSPNSNYNRPDPNIILVLGASGRLGEQIVKALLSTPGNIVLACVKSNSENDQTHLKNIAATFTTNRNQSRLGQRASLINFLEADLATDVSFIAEQAKLNSVGTIVFAASSGPGASPGLIDNHAVRQLVHQMESTLGSTAEARDLNLFDFSKTTTERLALFSSVDDRVMGGISTSQMLPSKQRNSAVFKGNVTTASNGGFAQARAFFAYDDLAQPQPIDLSHYAGLCIRCRGDGRRYKLNLKDDLKPENVFQVSFGTTKDQWQSVRLPFSDFLPVRRGRLAYSDTPGSQIYASAIDLTNLVSIGIVVSKIEPGGGSTPGFESGPFELEISRIAAYRASRPRFVLISSAGVTRPFWDEREKASARSAYEIPIVQLNPSNILGHKLAGENALRKGTIPWTVVRPTGLNDQLGTGRRIVLRQGDTLTGTIGRADVARVVASALKTTASTWKSFEAGANYDEIEGDADLNEDLFAGLNTDVLESQYEKQTASLH